MIQGVLVYKLFTKRNETNIQADNSDRFSCVYSRYNIILLGNSEACLE